MSVAESVCERCGAPLTGDGADEGDVGAGLRTLCAGCVQAARESAGSRSGGINRAAVVITGGLLVLVVSVFADQLAFGQSEGFGWKQRAGLVLAGVLLLVGAIMRISTLLVIAAIAGGLAILADWLGFGNAPGFGWVQILGSLLGVVLIFLGWGLARSQSNTG